MVVQGLRNAIETELGTALESATTIRALLRRLATLDAPLSGEHAAIDAALERFEQVASAS